MSILKQKWSIERIRDTAKVDDRTGCWNWPKDTRKTKVHFGGRNWSAYQLSLFLSKNQRVTPEKPHVAHSCGNYMCVNFNHLETKSVLDNARDRAVHGTQPSGENHYNCKLTDIQVQEIRESKEPAKSLSDKYDVSAHTIKLIRNGQSRVQDVHAKNKRRQRLLELRNKRLESIGPKDYKEALYRAESESKESYAVPNDSTIILLTKCLRSKYVPDEQGYTCIGVRGKRILLHVLSAMVHLNDCKPIPKGFVVRHLCKDKGCFNHEHLKIGTRRENTLDVLRAGSRKAKISEEQVRQIYLQKGQVTEATVLSKIYNISYASINNIWKKRTWSHITDKLDQEKTK